MRKLFFVGLALVTALTVAPGAKADTFYIGVGGGLTGTGTLTGTLIGGDEYNITSASLTINGSAATLVANPYSTNPAYDDFTTSSINSAQAGGNDQIEFDDILTVGGTPDIDGNGLLFELADGEYINLFSDGDSTYWLGYGPADSVDFTNNVFGASRTNAFTSNFNDAAGGGAVTFTASATPEPSSLMLLGTGLFLLGGFLFRKSRQSVVSAA